MGANNCIAEQRVGYKWQGYDKSSWTRKCKAEQSRGEGGRWMTEGGKRRRLKATTPSRSYVSLQCPSYGDDYQDFWSQIPRAVTCALNGDFWSQLCAFMCHLSMPWWMWAATIELICEMERSSCDWLYYVGYPEKRTAKVIHLKKGNYRSSGNCWLCNQKSPNSLWPLYFASTGKTKCPSGNHKWQRSTCTLLPPVRPSK